MGAVRIADFGLSRFYADVQALTGGLGTYQWMAPEVLAHQKYSTRADVYSFGIVSVWCGRAWVSGGCRGRLLAWRRRVSQRRCVSFNWEP